MDCYQAAEDFTKLVDSLELNFWVTPRPEKKKNNVITLPFVASISDGVTELITKWTAGEGVAYHWANSLTDGKLRTYYPYRHKMLDVRQALKSCKAGYTISETEIRSKARAAYRPKLSDVMQSLVMESAYDQDPREFGEMFDNGGDAIEAWQIASANAPKVRSLLGSSFERALELSYNI